LSAGRKLKTVTNPQLVRFKIH